MKYTGLNKYLRIRFIEVLKTRFKNGTMGEVIEDWKWIFSFSLRYKWVIVLYTLLGIFSSTLTLTSAYISRILINIITEKQTDKLWLLIFLMLFTTLFSLAFSSLMSRVSLKITIMVNNDIQSEIFDSIMDTKWSELHKYPNGDLLNRFNNDVSTIANNTISWIPNIIISIYSFILTFVVLFRMDPIMAFIAVLSAHLLLGVSNYIMKRLKEYRKKVLELNSRMMSFETETFYNFDTIKSFGVQDNYSNELRKWQKKYKKYSLDYNAFEIKTNVIMTAISTFVSMSAFGYCLYRLWTGQILYGDMTFFLTQRSTITKQFNSVVATIPGMLNSSVSAHRIKELVNLKKEEHNIEDKKLLDNLSKKGLSVEVRDVCFGYEEEGSVISNGNFIARPNETVAVLGKSGGGKTTLFRLLLGLIDPEKGLVSFVDKQGNHYKVNADVRELISYVPQGNTMILGTIRENMLMVKKDASDEEIIECLKKACAYEFVQKVGLDCKLGERGRGISEGQAQRLAIARALLKDAPILLLDEVTSALDENTENMVLDNIISNSENKTIIVSTHRPSVLGKCQRIYRISDKEISEE